MGLANVLRLIDLIVNENLKISFIDPARILINIHPQQAALLYGYSKFADFAAVDV
jgi:hypothetical protein